MINKKSAGAQSSATQFYDRRSEQSVGVGYHVHPHTARLAVSYGDPGSVFAMVVGWSLSSSLSAEMVLTALHRAIRRRRPTAGLMFHSDRGVQYACNDFRKLLEKHHFIQSMSRKGDCWNNSVAESFFSILKSERVHRERFVGPQDTLQSIFEYIEVYYNHQRRHSTLAYLSPAEFENNMKSASCF